VVRVSGHDIARAARLFIHMKRPTKADPDRIASVGKAAFGTRIAELAPRSCVITMGFCESRRGLAIDVRD
jgi:hypothetical protein